MKLYEVPWHTKRDRCRAAGCGAWVYWISVNSRVIVVDCNRVVDHPPRVDRKEDGIGVNHVRVCKSPQHYGRKTDRRVRVQTEERA